MQRVVVAVLGVLEQEHHHERIVVEVLVTSCQVSEKPNSGPLTSDSSTKAKQPMNLNG